MDYSEIRIRSFLKFGYFMGPFEHRYRLDFTRIDRTLYRNIPEPELIRIGAEKLRQTFSQLFVPHRDHVVPLSGGLDSRLVLAALLEFTEARKIQTYTYGVPGAYDYELGCRVAKHVGTVHVPMPLDNFVYNWDDLLDVAIRTRCQGAILHHPPALRFLERFRAGLIWSGYVGDATAGGHLPARPARTLAEARRRYMKNRAFVRSTKLHGCDDDVFLPYVSGGTMDPDVMSWDEQVLFAEAVPKFAEPLILFPPFEYRTPLINSPWSDFMFSVPNEFRLGELLMTRIGQTEFPAIFGLPTKNSAGLRLTAPPALQSAQRQLNRVRKLVHQVIPRIRYPYVLYNDFNEAMRTSSDLRAIARECLERLDRRGIVGWLNLDGLWKRHQWRLQNLGDALLVLTSLELVLSASEQQS